MQWEKASALAGAELLADEDVLAVCEARFATPVPLEPLPVHAAASRARTAIAMKAAAVRAMDGRARGTRRTTRVLSFIMPSSMV
jgi:hypothetical protein